MDGTVYGQGTSKSDSVMVRLSKGEEVIQEPYASQNRSLLKQINAGMFRGYAGGGTVDSRYVRYASSGGAGGTRSAPVLNVTVQAAPGMDEQQLTARVVREIRGLL